MPNALFYAAAEAGAEAAGADQQKAMQTTAITHAPRERNHGIPGFQWAKSIAYFEVTAWRVILGEKEDKGRLLRSFLEMEPA